MVDCNMNEGRSTKEGVFIKACKYCRKRIFIQYAVINVSKIWKYSPRVSTQFSSHLPRNGKNHLPLRYKPRSEGSLDRSKADKTG